MPEIKRTFNVGKMNRDLDDRIVPAGEYREGLNINIGQSESSDVGAIENLLGNKLVGQNGLTGNSKCIGQVSDSNAEKIYFFVTTNSIYNETNSGSHGIYEYDQNTKQVTGLLVSQQLNFHQSYPITGVNVVDDLLFWTDDRNYPRKINVVTARNNTTYYGNVADASFLYAPAPGAVAIRNLHKLYNIEAITASSAILGTYTLSKFPLSPKPSEI